MVAEIEQRSEVEVYKSKRSRAIWGLVIFGIVQRIIVIAINNLSAGISPAAATTFNVISYLIAFGLCVLACYYWARYKNRPAWLMFLGLIGILGFIPMALIPAKKDMAKS